MFHFENLSKPAFAFLNYLMPEKRKHFTYFLPSVKTIENKIRQRLCKIQDKAFLRDFQLLGQPNLKLSAIQIVPAILPLYFYLLPSLVASPDDRNRYRKTRRVAAAVDDIQIIVARAGLVTDAG